MSTSSARSVIDRQLETVKRLFLANQNLQRRLDYAKLPPNNTPAGW